MLTLDGIDGKRRLATHKRRVPEVSASAPQLSRMTTDAAEPSTSPLHGKHINGMTQEQNLDDDIFGCALQLTSGEAVWF